MTAKLRIVRGSGNVFRDLELPGADIRQLKATLAAVVIKTLDKKELGVRRAHSLTGIDARHFSRVRDADYGRISVERLIRMANVLGTTIDFAVKVRPERVVRWNSRRPFREEHWS